MEYLSIEDAQWFAHRRRILAVFKTGSGAKCIYCGEPNGTDTGAKTLKSGKIVHYHVCAACGNGFTSEEKNEK